MESSQTKYQVVFLIDCNVAETDESYYCNEVRLTVFRLLSLFYRECRKFINVNKNNSDKFVPKSSYGTSANHEGNIKWGYKFFNSASTIPRNKLEVPSFKSFKLAHVEDFEKKLNEIFALVKGGDDKRKSLSHPAELLSITLTEILHDFNWRECEIMTSPVTRRRGYASTEEQSLKNMVYLLARAPLSKQSLRKFSNKMVIDSEVFIDSFMSPALLSEFQDKLRISLHWVDFASTPASKFVTQDEGVAQSIHILKDSCRKLNGSFVTKDMILRGVPAADLGIFAGQTLDHLHIYNFCFEARRSEFNSATDTVVSTERMGSKLSCEAFQDIPVKLVPVTRQQKTRSLFTAGILYQRNNSALGKQDFSTVDLSDAQFTVLGYAPQAEVCDMLMTHVSHSFLIESEGSSDISSLFQQLATSESFAVLGVQSQNKPAGVLAALTAETESLGFISMLDLRATYHMEKFMLQHNDGKFRGSTDTECDSGAEKNDKCTQQNSMAQLNDDVRKLYSCQKTDEGLPKVEAVDQSQIFQSHTMNSWHVPGSTNQMSSLITKITDRLDVLDNLSKSEKDMLKQLQKHYTKERRPVEIVENLQPSTSTPICAFRNVQAGSSGGSESGSRSSFTDHGRRRSSTLSRGRLMVDKARSANFSLAGEGEGSLHSKPGTPERRLSNSFELALDIDTKDELGKYLEKQYDQVVNAGVALVTTVSAMMTVTSRYMTNKHEKDPQQSAVSFIQHHLIKSSVQLREKYANKTSEADVKCKTAEYKLQVMLRLQMESVQRGTETRTTVFTEVVALLRGLSFIIGPTSLREFLNDIVVARYAASLPQLLMDIYDELMLPLPPALAKLASPAAPSSVWGAPLSVKGDDSLMSAPGSSQPPSHQSEQQRKRSSKFKQQPSIADFRHKKQILVKPTVKAKSDTKKTGREKTKGKSQPTHTRHKDYERAKRNLFSDKTKPSHGRVKEKKDKIRHRRRQRRSSVSDKSRPLVLGTPAHKQTSKRLLQQQERRRRRHETSEPEVQVVAESPVKDDDGDAPILNRPARYIVREAFYSSSSQPSRNLAKSLELAQKEDRPSVSYRNRGKSQGTLASAVRGESPVSPGTRLIKSFMSSPSPTPKAKQKGHKSSTPLRRSPRKSAKKLDFRLNDNNDSGAGPSKSAGAENVHLVFDGENANDSGMLRSPPRHLSRSFREGYKTPEKQVHNRPAVWQTESCPPLLLTPPRKSCTESPQLSFRNILSQQDGSGSPSHDLQCDVRKGNIVRSDSTSTMGRTPEKEAPKSPVFTSPNQASKLRAAYISRSPKRLSHLTSPSGRKLKSSSPGNEYTEALGDRISVISPRRRDFLNMNVNNGLGQPQQTMSPKKLINSQSADVMSQVYSTPSKVKFSATDLISPPTGSGYPPSAEKSTPGKSILKNSPIIKGKVKRRVELQSLSDVHVTTPAAETVTNIRPLSKSASPFQSSRQDDSHKDSQVLLGDPSRSEQHSDTKAGSESKGTIKAGTSKQDIGQLQGQDKRTFSTDNLGTHQEKSNVKRNPRIEVSFSSSDDSSDIPNAGVQAAITIRTPSPSHKSRPDSISEWARRKRCSSKNNSSSSSASILSPTSSSSSSGGKGKQPAGSQTNCDGKENTDGRELTQVHSLRNSVVQSVSRKRSLFSADDSTNLEPSRKRQRKHSGKRPEEHVISNSSLDRADTDMFGPGNSPDPIPCDNEVFPPGTFAVPTTNSMSLSSQEGTSGPSAMLSQPKHQSPHKRLTRQVSGMLEEGSQGFHVQVTHPQVQVSTQSAQQAGTSTQHSQTSSKLLQFSQQDKLSPLDTDIPAHSDTEEIAALQSKSHTTTMPKTKSTTSATISTGAGSPLFPGSGGTSPERLQYSPSLSASGLMKLIKSPLLSPRSRQSHAHNRDGQSRTTRAKSRKHLDLNVKLNEENIPE